MMITFIHAQKTIDRRMGKIYLPVIQTKSGRRFLRRRFKRASDACAYGQVFVQRCTPALRPKETQL